MKIAFALLATAALVLASTSCDSHPWEETQVLHEGMHKDHGEGHGPAHGDDPSNKHPGAAQQKSHEPAPAHAPEAKH